MGNKAKYTYQQFLKDKLKIEMKLETVQPPYYRHIRLLDDGGIEFHNDSIFTPEEAVRVAKWILDYYAAVASDGDE